MVRPDQTSLIVKKDLHKRLKKLAVELETPIELMTEQALEDYVSSLEKTVERVSKVNA